MIAVYQVLLKGEVGVVLGLEVREEVYGVPTVRGLAVPADRSCGLTGQDVALIGKSTETRSMARRALARNRVFLKCINLVLSGRWKLSSFI